jgi:hypothetical protein
MNEKKAYIHGQTTITIDSPRSFRAGDYIVVKDPNKEMKELNRYLAIAFGLIAIFVLGMLVQKIFNF